MVYTSPCVLVPLGFLLIHLTYFRCFRWKLSAPCKFPFATLYYKGNVDDKVRQTGPDCLKVHKMSFSSLVRWQKSLVSLFSRWQKTIKQSTVLQETFMLWSKTPNSWYENKVQRPKNCTMEEKQLSLTAVKCSKSQVLHFWRWLRRNEKAPARSNLFYSST